MPELALFTLGVMVGAAIATAILALLDLTGTPFDGEDLK